MTEEIPELFSYRSITLERYTRFLASCLRPHLLDIGPLCDTNITFFTSFSARLSVNNLFPILDSDQSANLLPGALGEYSPHSFDGIHLWDIPDHVDDTRVSEIQHVCARLLRPGGILFSLSHTIKAPQPRLRYFTATAPCDVTLHTAGNTPLPFYYRSFNRMQQVMRPSFTVKFSYLYPAGLREYLFIKTES